MELIFIIATLIVAYLIGSINTAILVGRLISGDDIRNHGSGNAGMTNTLRTYGKKAAVMVLLGDALKAVVAIVIAKITGKLLNLDESTYNLMIYGASFGAVLGHNFPLYFGFRGGKGVLVSAVSILMVDWKIGLAVVIIALLIMATTRYVSLGSILGAVTLIVSALIFKNYNIPFIIYSILLAALLIVMHRTNIVRLIHGTENKLGQKKQDK